MPRGVQTGPQGMGPMTGRAAGYCAGYDAPGYADSAPGRGYGRGMAWRRGGRGRGGQRGGGRGWGYAGPAQPAPAPVEEKTFLEQEVAGLRAQLAYLEERLKGLEPPQEEDAQE